MKPDLCARLLKAAVLSGVILIDSCKPSTASSLYSAGVAGRPRSLRNFSFASGVAFASTNNDGWSGQYFSDEKQRLFNCIYENKINGVIAISGDSHRTEIIKHKLNVNSVDNVAYLHDFTSSPLFNENTKKPDQSIGLRIYSNDDNPSTFGEIDFYPVAENGKKIVFREFSYKGELTFTYTLNDDDLNYFE